MDPNNYRIHKRRAPSHTPRLQTGSYLTSRQSSALNRPIKPIRLEPKAKTHLNTVAKIPTNNQTYRRKPVEVGSQQALLRQNPITLPRKPAGSVEYTISAPANNKHKVKKSKKKLLIGVMIVMAILATVAVFAGLGYYYYNKKAEPVEASPVSKTQPQTSKAINADFVLYKTKNGSLFKSEQNYEDGKQNSKVLIANSTKDNKQVVITQQKVDKYFTTDPNGLDKLLISVGENSQVPIKDGMSYIVKGNTTAMTVKGETLVVIRSTAELSQGDWIELFDSLEVNKY
jgi:Tfp pilus assembly major pilin PilA